MVKKDGSARRPHPKIRRGSTKKIGRVEIGLDPFEKKDTHT